jgi:hypothetical protein
MPLATPLTTFGELARDHPEIEVTCGDCDHRRQVIAIGPSEARKKGKKVPKRGTSRRKTSRR